MTQINPLGMADIFLPPDFAPVIEVKGPDGKPHKIYANPVGASFLTQMLEQNQQLHALASRQAKVFEQLTPYIGRCIIPDSPTSEEQIVLNSHLQSILEILSALIPQEALNAE